MQLIANALIAGSLGALIAGGLALVYGVQGVFNLALGQVALVGGYSAWWLVQEAGLPLVPGLIGGLCAGGLVAWVTQELCVEPFVRRHRFLPLVTTIAWSMILDGVLLMVFEARPRSILPGVKMGEFLGAQVSNVHLTLIATTIALLIVAAWVLHATSLGRRIRAVVQHEHAAQSIGIRAGALQRGLFIASGVLAAAGGLFIGIDQTLTPTLGFSLTIKAYAAVIAGGKGNLWGAVLCAYGIALLEQLAIGVRWGGLTIPAGYQQVVALLCIIIFLCWRPDGLFGARQRTA
jgi:branched-subunit amino acid ABC-type transport system permease component